jgi:hypothetical protein
MFLQRLLLPVMAQRRRGIPSSEYSVNSHRPAGCPDHWLTQGFAMH